MNVNRLTDDDIGCEFEMTPLILEGEKPRKLIVVLKSFTRTRARVITKDNGTPLEVFISALKKVVR